MLRGILFTPTLAFALCAALLSSRKLYAGTALKTVQWACPQVHTGSGNPPIPTSRAFDVTITTTTPAGGEPRLTMNWTEFRNLLRPFDPANPHFQASGPDYHDCAQRAVEDVQTAFWQSCMEQLRALSWPASDALPPNPTQPQIEASTAASARRSAKCGADSLVATGPLRAHTTRLGAAALARGAPPLVPPLAATAQIRGLPSPISQAFINETKNKLSQRCDLASLANDLDSQKRAAFALSNEFFATHLPAIMSDSSVSQKCKDRILASYLRAAADSTPSNEACAATPTPAACAQANTRNQRIVAGIRGYLPGGNLAEYDRLATCISTGRFAGENLSLLETEVREIHNCQPIGTEGRVINDPSDGGAGIYAQYKLSQPTSGGFRIELNVDFSVSGLAPGTPAHASFQTRTRAEVNQCLAGYGPMLRGPNNEPLEISLSHTSGPPPPPQIGIEVSREPTRANSNVWSSGMVTTVPAPASAPSGAPAPGAAPPAPPGPACSTILHELLHRLGLVDEYEEQAMGYHSDPVSGLLHSETGADPAFLGMNCRAKGPIDSVMSNQDAAVAGNSGSHVAFDCSCAGKTNPALSACRAALASMDATSRGCPREADITNKLNFGAIPPPPPEQMARFNAAPATGADGQDLFHIKHQTPVGKLLRPAQFRALTQPGCASANRLYYTCGRAAYRTSRGHGGAGCPRNLPASCSNTANLEEWLQ